MAPSTPSRRTIKRARCLAVVMGLWLVGMEAPAQLFAASSSAARRGNRCVMHQGMQDQAMGGSAEILSFGKKHKGKSFFEVVREDPFWALWMKNTIRNSPKSADAQVRFADFVEQSLDSCEELKVQVESEEREWKLLDDSKTMNCGKHKGESYTNVLQTNPAYALWAIEDSKRAVGLRHFAKWVNDNMEAFEEVVTTKFTADPKLLDEELDLARWAMNRGRDAEASQNMQHFAKWVEEETAFKEDVQTLSFGKYKGRSYSDVIREDPGYARRIMRMAEWGRDRPSMQHFADWAKENMD